MNKFVTTLASLPELSAFASIILSCRWQKHIKQTTSKARAIRCVAITLTISFWSSHDWYDELSVHRWQWHTSLRAWPGTKTGYILLSVSHSAQHDTPSPLIWLHNRLLSHLAAKNLCLCCLIVLLCLSSRRFLMSCKSLASARPGQTICPFVFCLYLGTLPFTMLIYRCNRRVNNPTQYFGILISRSDYVNI